MSIRIIEGPTVRLVGRQVIDEGELSAFLKDEDAENWETDTDISAEKLVEVSGRLCYKSYARPRPGGNAAYLGHILEVGHGSVIEHAVYNFIITGVSRSFSHELVRHRAGWAYSQRSQRFCDEAEAHAVAPPELLPAILLAERCLGRLGLDAFDALQAWELTIARLDELDRPRLIEDFRLGLWWLASVSFSRRAYGALSDGIGKRLASIEDGTLRRKRAREAARSVLPNATETQLFVTANARALRCMFEQRGAVEADAEIRRLAVAMCRVMKAESPNLFADFEVAASPDGIVHLTNKYRKV